MSGAFDSLSNYWHPPYQQDFQQQQQQQQQPPYLSQGQQYSPPFPGQAEQGYPGTPFAISPQQQQQQQSFPCFGQAQQPPMPSCSVPPAMPYPPCNQQQPGSALPASAPDWVMQQARDVGLGLDCGPVFQRYCPRIPGFKPNWGGLYRSQLWKKGYCTK